MVEVGELELSALPDAEKSTVSTTVSAQLAVPITETYQKNESANAQDERTDPIAFEHGAPGISVLEPSELMSCPTVGASPILPDNRRPRRTIALHSCRQLTHGSEVLGDLKES
jgi:hypothetical protein